MLAHNANPRGHDRLLTIERRLQLADQQLFSELGDDEALLPQTLFARYAEHGVTVPHVRALAGYALTVHAHPSIRAQRARAGVLDAIASVGAHAAHELSVTGANTPYAIERRAAYARLHYLYPEVLAELVARFPDDERAIGEHTSREHEETLEDDVRNLLLHKRR
jgi:hypothetical protein